MEFETVDIKKVNDVACALRCRGLYMVECMGEKCPYYTKKYLPIENCDIVQLRKDFNNVFDTLKMFLNREEGMTPKAHKEEDGYTYYYCGYCGYEIDPDIEHYCSLCGSKIKD